MNRPSVNRTSATPRSPRPAPSGWTPGSGSTPTGTTSTRSSTPGPASWPSPPSPAPGSRRGRAPSGSRPAPHAHRAHGRLDLHLVGLPADANPLGLDSPAVLAVDPLLRELIVAYTLDPRDTGPERGRLLAVLCDQLRASPQQPLRLPTPRDPRLAEVCALVHADPADTRTLAALGAATGTAERTLSRLFRREFGMTFPQWRTQSRLYHALRMLADDLPVTTVAHRCGWSSASAFIDVFRRAFGCTPGTHNRRAGTAHPPVLTVE